MRAQAGRAPMIAVMPPSARTVRAASLAALAGAAAISARALTRPRAGGDRRLLDWEAVRRVAGARSGEPERLDPAQAATLAAEYDSLAAELAPLMAEVTAKPPATFPRFTVIDRHGFIDANLDIVGRLMEPVERLRAEIPESLATSMGRSLMSRYVGEMFGFMSQRVLGQYDPVLMLPAPAADATRAPSALYLVEPNVVAFEQGHHADRVPLRQWLILHELTHAWQFEMHPWLGEHIGSLMNELLMSGLVEEVTRGAQGGGKLGNRDLLRKLPDQVRGQLRGVSRLQAVMSVLEGYSNFVMHGVGRAHIEGFDELEDAFHKRKTERTLLERLVLTITGINLKLRQYEIGEKFCDAVTAAGGDVNRVWDGPAMMPSMAELREPRSWLRRTGQLA
jgi:coenzyme F420 biosynthesis associated uncharacterized protein